MKTVRICLLALVALLADTALAQAPKWANKAKEAVFSVITYDADGKMLGTGNGFYITEDGVAVSDYTLFKGAEKAEVIGPDGKTLAVSEILGANEMYDAVKFRVAITDKVQALQTAAASPAVGEAVYLLPYSTQQKSEIVRGQVRETTKIESTYSYYTLDLALKDKMVSCPLVNANGQVFAMAQMSSDDTDSNTCYALDVRYAASQSINALSLNDRSLRGIGIKKGLPETEEQALVMLYMASTTTTAQEYATLLEDFIAKFPDSSDGYLRRAQYNAAQPDADKQKVEADLEEALSRATDSNKAETLYQYANIVYNSLLAAPDAQYKDWTWDKALGQVREAVSLNPQPAYYQLLGDIAFAKQDYSGAYAAFENVNRSNLASAASYYSAAHSKEMMDAPIEEVTALMDTCISKLTKPYTQEAAPYLLERARIYMKANNGRGAMLDYEEYYKIANGQVTDQFYELRSQAELQARAYQRAIDDLKQAIEMNADESTYRAELAAVHLRVGQYQEASNVLDEAIGRNPDYAELYRLKGLALIMLDKKKDARPLLDKAKEMGDSNVDALIEKYYN